MPLFHPDDAHNRTLRANVFPEKWTNPTPTGKYNLVVLGGGTTGLICASGAAGLGAKVALVERHALGGDCLNVGCVPSKALLRAARAAHEARSAGERFGVHARDIEVDFPAVMKRMRRLRASIAPVDSARRYSEELGVDVYLGEARFTSPTSLEVDGQRLDFARAVIATGARPARVPIPGLWECGAHTNESIFSLTELPKRLAIIGAGPIGCELAQAFARFGAKVTLLDRNASILPRDDPDAAAIVEHSLLADGVSFKRNCTVTCVDSRNGERVLSIEGDQNGREDLVADAILVAAGRAANVEHLGLEAAGVEFNERGVITDDRLRTTNKHIFAAGDVALQEKFTHAADAAARLVLQNALFYGRRKLSSLTIPHCTYTDPELGHVGLTPRDAAQREIEIDTFTQDLAHLDRAILDGETAGFVKIHVRKGTSKIVGATVVASHAGDLLAGLSLALTNRLGLDQIANTIHCYPTQAEAIKRAADAWNRTRLTPRVAKLFRKLLAWQRR